MNTEFMRTSYSTIGEPLNLLMKGQQWFRRIYDHECEASHGLALVLGATSWMADILSQRHKKTIVVDLSSAMLHMISQVLQNQTFEQKERIELVQANWLEMPAVCRGISTVLGDNSLSFLPYPDGWLRLFSILADRMESRAKLITRFLSVPHGHRPMSVEDIVVSYSQTTSVNYTAVRVRLLFSHWNPVTCGIDTELVAQTFEERKSEFEPLFQKFPSCDNDLKTVAKYKGFKAVYYAPPLEQVLSMVAQEFDVISVHFGKYDMSQYFPLIVASRK
jgi:hypothetical protein